MSQYFLFGMNAMNKLMRSLIAIPIIVCLSGSGGVSIAALPSASLAASAETTLSLAGFLDFKTLLYSSGTGENLDGVFDQIKFIQPAMFRNAALQPALLRQFKSSQSPLLPASPVWRWDENDLDVLNVEVYGSPSSASSELVDAILTDITDNIRNHGISWSANPAIGPGTTTYFNSATQKVIGLIEKLENAVPGELTISRSAEAIKPAAKISYLLPAFFIGLVLVMIGLVLRRSGRKSPLPTRKADPAACIDAIQNSPIRYSPKTS